MGFVQVGHYHYNGSTQQVLNTMGLLVELLFINVFDVAVQKIQIENAIVDHMLGMACLSQPHNEQGPTRACIMHV